MHDNNTAHWIDLPAHRDPRGVLTSLEGGQDIPFAIRRVFYMHHMTADRGGHAHIDTDQVAIAASGRFCIELSDQHGTRRYLLDNPDRGLYIPRLAFIDIRDISADAVCLVLASSHYDPRRSLRSREAWLAHLRTQRDMP